MKALSGFRAKPEPSPNTTRGGRRRTRPPRRRTAQRRANTRRATPPCRTEGRVGRASGAGLRGLMAKRTSRFTPWKLPFPGDIPPRSASPAGMVPSNAATSWARDLADDKSRWGGPEPRALHLAGTAFASAADQLGDAPVGERNASDAPRRTAPPLPDRLRTASGSAPDWQRTGPTLAE